MESSLSSWNLEKGSFQFIFVGDCTTIHGKSTAKMRAAEIPIIFEHVSDPSTNKGITLFACCPPPISHL